MPCSEQAASSTSTTGTLPRPDLARRHPGRDVHRRADRVDRLDSAALPRRDDLASMIVVTTWPVMRSCRRRCGAAGPGRCDHDRDVAACARPAAVARHRQADRLHMPASVAREWAARRHATFTMPPPPPEVGSCTLSDRQGGRPCRRATRSPPVRGRSRDGGGALRCVGRRVDGGRAEQFGRVLVQFLLTIAIAAVMYANGENAADGLLRFGRHHAGRAWRPRRPPRRAGHPAASRWRGRHGHVQAALAGVGLAVAGVPLRRCSPSWPSSCASPSSARRSCSLPRGVAVLAGCRRDGDRAADLDARRRHCSTTSCARS